ncbi:MAG: hypothetical protein C5B43_01035 [Verrucomicrobia bacterium]|nr:MAG: hypothetical protein C5B43_01035 [Verrucomicrobiota bacterium]
MKNIKTSVLLSVLLNLLFNLSWGSDKSPVVVVVNSELYPQIKESIDTYIADLKKEEYTQVFVLEWDNKVDADVDKLREVLRNYHEDFSIQGAVLIGQLPYAQGEIAEDQDSVRGPVDTYLMDLRRDAFFKDWHNYVIVRRSDGIHLDIWVSRIWAPNDGKLFLGVSEADLIKGYFEKNHLYRSCQFAVPDLKLKFVGSVNRGTKGNSYIEFFSSWRNWYHYIDESGEPSEYLEFVKNNPAQYLVFSSHSNSKRHYFDKAGSGEEKWLDSKNISNAQIRQPFVLLHACSACKFTDSESLGHAYLFGPNSGVLAIVGNSMWGNLRNIQFMYSNGSNFGSNSVSYFNYYGPDMMIRDKENRIMWENTSFACTLLGDGTLKAYVDMDWCQDRSLL